MSLESRIVECRDGALALASDAIQELVLACPKPSVEAVEACALSLKLQATQLFSVANEMRDLKARRPVEQMLPVWLR